jgi:hypothetical protein
VTLALVIQFVPYGRDHRNPPVRAEPTWDSAQTRALAVRACFACHSNQVEWPWYSNVAPFSWLTQRDVEEGRRALNFSEWDRPQEEAGEAAETVREGEMPPVLYRLAHPNAQLSEAETQALVQGLVATIGQQDEGGRGRDGRR